jgi:hypothetical protein
MENKKKITWIIIGLVVVVGGAAYFGVAYKKNKNVSPAAVVNTPEAPAINDLTPIKGALPPNFPAALLVGTDPTIVSSGYNLDQANNQDVWVVTAISTKTLDVFAKAYDAYFKTNKWTVVKKTQDADQLYYFAMDPKTGENVTVNINALPNGINNIYLTLKQPHAQ